MDFDFSWKNKYKVGFDEIDFEHQVFLKIIKKIDENFKESGDANYSKLLMEELYKYSDFHFRSEENLMIKYKYPYYQNHKKEHQRLLSNLSELLVTFDVKFIDKENLIHFLLDWFVSHTTKVDIKFGQYLNELNIEK